MPTTARRVLSVFRLLRPWDWTKNALVLLPMLLATVTPDEAMLRRVLLAFAAFCAAASANYCLNDALDRVPDRLHPFKGERPLAAGAVGLPVALALAVPLYVVAGYIGWYLGRSVFDMVALFVALGIVYSLVLRNLALLDLLAIGVAFVLRVDAGAAAAGYPPAVWLIIFAFLIGVFSALAKRRDDVMAAQAIGGESGRPGYNEAFLNVATSIFLTVTVIAYVVFAADRGIAERMHVDRLHFTIPFVVGAALRYLQVILVEERPGDPFRLVWRDPFMLTMVVGWAATLAVLMHDRSA